MNLLWQSFILAVGVLLSVLLTVAILIAAVDVGRRGRRYRVASARRR
jgi:hypothetical protein